MAKQLTEPDCQCSISEAECTYEKLEYAHDLFHNAVDVLAHATDRLTFTGDFDAVAEVAGLIPGAVDATKILDRLVSGDGEGL